MPHADSSFIPDSVTTKRELYDHILQSLDALIEDNQNWITCLANAASLLYSSLGSDKLFGTSKRVNWTGFYLRPDLFPPQSPVQDDRLLLGPFCGRPACQFVRIKRTNPSASLGVCAEAYTTASTQFSVRVLSSLRFHSVLVADVHAKPGHIACDANTKSEIVVPIVVNGIPIGVLDLDCEAIGAFDEEDKRGLEGIAQLLAKRTNWQPFGSK